MLFLQFLNNVSIIKTKVLLPRAHVTVANSRACGSYQDFLDRGLLLTRKLLNLVKLKSSLRKFDRYGLSVSQITTISSTSRSFPHSWLITGFVTILKWRVPPVEQELFTLPDHLSSPQVLSGVRATRSLVLCVCFVDRCLSFCTFLLAIVLSVLRYTDSDYPFVIFKLFLALVLSPLGFVAPRDI